MSSGGRERHFVPDFRIWLSNGEFLVVETKSEWLARKPKEREKIMAGFARYRDRFMVVGDDLGELERRIGLAMSPMEFSFDEVRLETVPASEYLDFYGAFHYLGRSGRRGWTVGARLGGTLVGAVTVGPVVRAEMASRHGLEQSEVRELVRFCLHPDYQRKNFASWLLSRAVSRYGRENPEVRLLTSFADPAQGHSGTIYLAANWLADGMTSPSYHYVAVDGSSVHKKTVYDRARRCSMSEREYSELNCLRRVREPPKYRFLLWLRIGR